LKDCHDLCSKKAVNISPQLAISREAQRYIDDAFHFGFGCAVHCLNSSPGFEREYSA